MAKRELLERIKIEPEGCRGWLYEDKPITEQDIIMPFLEKLKIRLAEIARKVDSDKVVGLVMAINEINILSQEFQDEAHIITERKIIKPVFKEFREKLSRWMFHNCESVRGDNMIDIDYLEGHMDELMWELGIERLPEDSNE